MSILIKNMEMPTSCYDCNCFIRDSDGSDYCCLLMQDIVDNNKRDNDCPLVPVPPHGRLGDLDELCSRLEGWYQTYKRAFSETEAIYIRAILAGVKDTPTIIPAEEGE